MNILVTGAAGFIGSHLISVLIEKGNNVRGLLMPHEDARELETSGVEIVRGNLTDPASLRGIANGIDTVYHLAARTLDWGPLKQFESIVIDGTRNLLDECKRNKISRFIYASSLAALGMNRELKGLDETAEPLKCGIPYCDTKNEAEALVKKICAQSSMDYTIIRPANVIGPGSVWVREILDKFEHGTFPLINKGEAPGAFIYIDNLVDGMILAAESEIGIGKTYHFHDDYTLNWHDYLNTLSSWTGKKPSFNVPFRAAWISGTVMEKLLSPFGVRPPVTRLAAAVMGRNNEFDNRLARQELGWQSTVSRQEAMRRIRKWVQTRYQAPFRSKIRSYYNKTVFITGGSSGIGLEIAALLIRKGAHVILMARGAQKLNEAMARLKLIKQSHHQVTAVFPMDVADPDDVNQTMARATEEFGPPDIVINSAGILDTNYFENISPESFDSVIKVNLYGVRNVITAVLPAMKKRGNGHIVNIASAAGLMGLFGYSSYSASKFAVIGMSECLRSELKQHNISISVVCPARVLTNMDEQELETIPPETRAIKRLSGTMTPAYVAKATLKGLSKNRFLIIPGYIFKIQYFLQRYLGGYVSMKVIDKVIQLAADRNRKTELNQDEFQVSGRVKDTVS